MKKEIEYRIAWIEDLKTPKLPYSEVMKDYWFAADVDGNPIYQVINGRKSFMCNANKEIVEKLGPKYIPIFDHVIRIPYAFTEHECTDYVEAWQVSDD